jgi:GcrA cell cycle regulator
MMKEKTTYWGSEDILELQRLVETGKNSRQIGIALGRSRNAIIGKCNRMGLQLKGSPSKEKSKKTRAPIKKKRSRPKRKPNHIPCGKYDETEQKPLLCGVLDLKPGMCKYPIGEPQDDDFGFCGVEAMKGYPYCFYHWKKTHKLERD